MVSVDTITRVIVRPKKVPPAQHCVDCGAVLSARRSERTRRKRLQPSEWRCRFHATALGKTKAKTNRAINLSDLLEVEHGATPKDVFIKMVRNAVYVTSRGKQSVTYGEVLNALVGRHLEGTRIEAAYALAEQMMVKR